MNPGLQEKVITERVAWIREMLAGIRSLPLASYEEFVSDRRNIAAAESYLRRALEALLDLGRHLLAKGFALAVSEYRETPQRLQEAGVLTAEEAHLMREMAGYRNRLVHFYVEVSSRELYEICVGQIGDIERLEQALVAWVLAHPDQIDRSL